MSRLAFLTYADQRYERAQRRLVREADALGAFDQIYVKTRTDLEAMPFYRKYQAILDRPRGGGFWAWKPTMLAVAMIGLDWGDVLLYVDAADRISDPDGSLRSFLLYGGLASREVLLTRGGYPNKHWTKRDCFVAMGCDAPEYHDVIQVEAGIIVCKVGKPAIDLLAEWHEWVVDARVVTDDPNVLGLPNLPGFVEHRHDQSILTNLSVKRGVPVTDEMRKYVTCNFVGPDSGHSGE